MLAKSEIDGIARAFVLGRRMARGLADYPGTSPADLDQAYAIQDAALALDGREVAGWKIGRINPPFDARFGTNRLAGPVFEDTISRTAGGDMPVIAEGFAAAEAEFLLQLAQDPDPAKSEWTVEQAREMIGAVHIGIEIASSPFVGINDHGPAVTVSDFGNNHGLLVGPELTDWHRRELNDIQVQTLINGETIGTATTVTMLDGPWGAVRFLLELGHRRGLALRRGQWVSTGAVTGVHQVGVGDRVEARFDNQSIACRITAAKPNEERERENVGSSSGG